GGGGSAMMCDPGRTVGLVRAVVEAVRVPVTVKMRLGWDEHSLSAPFFAREFERAGVAAVTVHGRTRGQGFGGSVSRAGIRAVVEAVQRIPVVGNGDVRTIADAARMFRETGCSAVAIGRGALLNPWVFRQLQSWEETGDPGPEPGYDARLAFMDHHFHLLVGGRGEHFGCLPVRKVANWYCRVLRTGGEVKQRLVMIGSVADFEAVVEQLRERGAPPGWEEWVVSESPIRVPAGPNERW